MSDESVAWNAAIARLLRISHLAQPSGLGRVLNEALAPLGVRVEIYLIDREQRALRPLTPVGADHSEVLDVDATVAGRAFSAIRPVTGPRAPRQIWAPILDGTERLGVLRADLPHEADARDAAVRESLSTLAVLIGHLLVAKMAYGDSIRRGRRSQPMSVGGELLWRMLPPLTFATDDLVLASVIEPCYDVGGDAYDYAVDNDRAVIAIYDAVGHDLNAAVSSTLALAATRSARTRGLDLADIASAADDVLTTHFTDLRYVTAIVADLDLRTGRMRIVNAGHPPPVVLRAGRSVAVLDGGRRLPLGLYERGEGEDGEPVTVSLEPDDVVLLYTDGITEARDAEGNLFGLPRLIEFAEREANAGLHAAEVARRLSHAVLDHQQGRLQDDATLMLIQWGPGIGTRSMG
jgi:hypothetical protein